MGEIYFDTPAKGFQEALPIGNGRLGAMIHGGFSREIIQLNQDSIWYGAPQDIYIPASYWVMGGAWLCTHIWTHCAYTLDRSFLEEYYPLLQDAVLFFRDFLVEHQGKLVTCPSVSPENTYIMENGTRGCACAGASMDNQILGIVTYRSCTRCIHPIRLQSTARLNWQGLLLLHWRGGLPMEEGILDGAAHGL